MTVMVRPPCPGVVSPQFRFVSVFFRAAATECGMNTLKTLIALALALAFSSHAVLALATAPAKPAPTVACQPDGNQAQLNACAAQDFEAATADYAKTYRTLSQSVGNQRRQLLRQAQTEWIQYRVKACEFERSGVAGGSVAPMVFAQCQARLTRERTADLRRFLECQEGDVSCARPSK